MKNDKDWEELEKWTEKKKQEDVEKFGVDFDAINIEKQNKKMSKVANVMDNATMVAIAILTIIGALIIFIIVFLMHMQFYNLRQRYDADINTIFDMYNIKVKLVSKDVDKEGNGRYIYKLKKNENIKFTVIKNKGDLSEDYVENCHKYYFDKWQSKSKESFTVEEEITEQGLLKYSTYIEIENFQDIEEAVNKIDEFLESEENMFYSGAWGLYIKKGEMRAYAPISVDDVKRYYIRYMKRTDPEQLENDKKLMTKEEIEMTKEEINI